MLFREDKFNDECGVFGVYGHEEAANLTYLGLYALQHRGQENAGIVSSAGDSLKVHKGNGLVADVFTPADIDRLEGTSAIGHVRYSTSGGSELRNAQPFVVDYSRGSIAVAHNGNIVNSLLLRAEFEAYGSIFQSTMDTEAVVHLIASCKERTLTDRIIYALGRLRGSYSIVFLTEDTLVVARDPHGFRPLALGKLKGAWVVASETCAFDLIDAEYVRDVAPGEVIVIDETGLSSYKPFAPVPHTPCIFEFIYFARPDSAIFGANVYDIRKEFGRELAKEHEVEADVVIPVPDSGVAAALGYAQAAGLPFELGIIRNHYVGRTFIEPKDSIRHFGVKLKLNAVRDVLEGKRVIVVDDSIVRGTTSMKIIKMIRDAGAVEVHMRVSSPPTICPCYYGIDTPNRDKLIAANQSIADINNYITSDTLGYLSVEGLYRAIDRGGGKGIVESSYCDACFTGEYPVDIFKESKPPQLVLFK
jgi:amidophosphoribosyltransferase